MSAIALTRFPPSSNLDAGLRALREREPAFFDLAVLLFLAMVPTAAAAYFDDRIFLGVDNWLKPLKFEAALAIYLITLAFFARWLPAGTLDRRWYRIWRWAVVAAIVAEMVWIAGAAALGTASHFNRAPVADILYSAMGVGAVLLTSATAVYAWQIGRNGRTGLAPALKAGVVAGLALAFPLTLLTAGMMAGMDGHTVGAAAGTTRELAVMGWSREAGDLRVSHFFATHTMHFVPLFALASVAAFGPGRRLPVLLFAALLTGFIAWTFFEALAGRPFLPGLG